MGRLTVVQFGPAALETDVEPIAPLAPIVVIEDKPFAAGSIPAKFWQWQALPSGVAHGNGRILGGNELQSIGFGMRFLPGVHRKAGWAQEVYDLEWAGPACGTLLGWSGHVALAAIAASPVLL